MVYALAAMNDAFAEALRGAIQAGTERAVTAVSTAPAMMRKWNRSSALMVGEFRVFPNMQHLPRLLLQA